MIIKLNNIGIIKNADIMIEGITVIGGANNCGKSTISKALFSIFHSLYNLDANILSEKKRSFISILQSFIVNDTSGWSLKINDIEGIERIIKDNAKYSSDKHALYNALIEVLSYEYMDNIFIDEIESKKDKIKNPPEMPSEEVLNELLGRLQEVLRVSDETIVKNIIWKTTINEFRRQVTNVNNDLDGSIALLVKEHECKITFEGIGNEKIKNVENLIKLRQDAVYFDDPYVIDRIGNRVDYNYGPMLMAYTDNHQSAIRRALMSDDKNSLIEGIIADEYLEKIEKIISEIVPGEIRSGDSWRYTYNESEKEAIDISNISSGMKTYLMIKMLLHNGTIAKNGTLILDEPEIHLHPEWQILFAEIIVLLHKEFGVHILLNTHSPYFLEAIEKYSIRYKADNNCRYYMAENGGDGVFIKDVTGNTEIIYRKLAEPFQTLQNISDKDEEIDEI